MGKLIQRTVYFREEDIDAWDAIANKAEWLHNHLDQPLPKTYTIEGSPKSEENTPALPKLEVKVKEFQINKELNFCKNGHAIPEGRTKCMGRGCQYAK